MNGIVLRMMLVLGLAVWSGARAYADMGAIIPSGDVTVDEPGQKAIIAHDGIEEVLILATDLTASQNTKALRFIPFPSEPKVSLAPKTCFENLGAVLKKHNVKYLRKLRNGSGKNGLGQSVEVRLEKRLGSHDITVVKIADADHFGRWVNDFFKKKGLSQRKLTSEEHALIADYVSRGFVYFVFDLVDLTDKMEAIAPVVYRFESREYFYYPLQTSNLFQGNGTVELYVFCDRGVVHNALNMPSRYLDKQASNQNRPLFSWSLTSTTAQVDRREMTSIAPEIADLLGANAFLCAYKYEGRIQFTTDLWLKTPLHVFGPRPGRAK